MQERKSLSLVIAGHVDHGKSTLIGRLLFETDSVTSDRVDEIERIAEVEGKSPEFAHLLDHLEEERLQCATIDTTQVFFKTESRDYAMIDVPGHVEFIRNMITGATQADAAVLIVDACEGVKEQTKRHAKFLTLLGIDQIIAVVNKMDLVGFSEQRFNEVKHEIGMFLSSVSIDAVSYIPVCATRGDNMTRKSRNTIWHKGPTLLDSLDALSEKRPAGHRPVIFPVQDIYRVDGKRIAVGRIEAGTLFEGAEIAIHPGGQTTKVRSIERYQEAVNMAKVGQSVGITTSERIRLKRGDVICSSGWKPTLSDRFNANIIWMSEHKLRKEQPLCIRCATQETTCEIESIKRRIDSSSLALIQEEADVLENLEVGEATIKTSQPILIRPFCQVPELGRFVLLKENDICAGGIIPGMDQQK